MEEKKTKKVLWGGRFSKETSEIMAQFNASIHYDKRLYNVDISGSKVYVEALKKENVVSEEEYSIIISGLSQVLSEWEAGKFEIKSEDEDIHSANERRLTELIGSTAGKLHTGRSRNDQVATDTKMYLNHEIKQLKNILHNLLFSFMKISNDNIDVLMPGYTHLQRAQPIRFSHLFMSYATFLLQDFQSLKHVSHYLDDCPLGSGALAGNPFNVDRFFIAEKLGFSSPSPNSLHSVSDRDFVLSFLNWASLFMIHVSRIAEDLIIYSSSEFKFISLSDSFSTGSSLMPQKKNPDSLELLRGLSGVVFGKLSGFYMTMKGTPSTYNKDFQCDKQPLFETIDIVKSSLAILKGVVDTMQIHQEKMFKALSMDMLATDLAEYLVMKNVPFRESHHIVGKVVQMSEQLNVEIDKLDISTLKTINSAFEEDVVDVWNFEKSVERRNSYGGTSKKSVLEQIKNMKKQLA